MEFDAETRELLGLDDIEEILGQIDEEATIDTERMEQEAQAVKEGADPANIKSPDEVIEEMDAEFEEDVDLSTASDDRPAAEAAPADGAGEEDAGDGEPKPEPETETE